MFAFILSLMISVPWLTQAQGKERDIHPAKIYGKKTFKEGGKLQITCSTFGPETECEEVVNYLCRDGIGIEKKISRERDVLFSIDGITKDFTGNYSCVYSKTEYSVEEVRGQGFESIFITVNENVNDAVRIVVGCSIALLLILCFLGLYGVVEKQGWCRCHSERSTEHGAEARGGDFLSQGHISYTNQMQNQPRFRSAAEWDDFSDSSENDHASNEDLYQVCEDV
ncbi:uncharacterized protein LOC108414153 isoform X3 [Pygocentrus nattereri]|uniref:uncharacterized protein LOC108414153 isoform X3 n=1 Tax=Pygocentrus nattereri TaxID=42514 RepID=UPI000814B14F|nr:uncharacterized protein LOC108414153 isoform X3 [Pygocentrus nattereri]